MAREPRSRLDGKGEPTRGNPDFMIEPEKALAAAIKKIEEFETQDSSIAVRDALSLLHRAQSLLGVHAEGEEYPKRARRGALGAMDMVRPNLPQMSGTRPKRAL